MSDEEYFTPDEVADRFKVTRRTVYRWVAEGRLQALKAGKGVRITKSALEEFLKAGQEGGDGK